MSGGSLGAVRIVHVEYVQDWLAEPLEQTGQKQATWRTDPARWQRGAAACLLGALVLLPGGFLIGGIYVYGGDPGPGVVLSPIGGGLLFGAVLLTALFYRPGRE